MRASNLECVLTSVFDLRLYCSVSLNLVLKLVHPEVCNCINRWEKSWLSRLTEAWRSTIRGGGKYAPLVRIHDTVRRIVGQYSTACLYNQNLVLNMLDNCEYLASHHICGREDDCQRLDYNYAWIKITQFSNDLIPWYWHCARKVLLSDDYE